jgi:Mce-associated membrane protein
MSAGDKTEQQNVEAAPDLEPSDGVEIDKTSEEADEAQQDDEEIAGDATSWIGGKVARSRRLTLATLVLVLLLLVSGALAAWLYVTQYRPDKQTDATAVQAATAAAQDGMIALLSYKSETLDQNVAAAKSHLTGDFVSDYEKRVREVVAPAVKGRGVVTTAQVIGAAVSELHSDSAVVLLFINQVSVSKDRPDTALVSSSVLVSLTKVRGHWLISKFQPI